MSEKEKTNLTVADFTKVAANIGFAQREIQYLAGSENIHATSEITEQQVKTLRQIVAASAFYDQFGLKNWLDDNTSHKIVSDAFNRQTPREIITQSPEGLDQYIAMLEHCAGGPLLAY